MEIEKLKSDHANLSIQFALKILDDIKVMMLIWYNPNQNKELFNILNNRIKELKEYL